jgi:hypothetical protein
MTQHSVETLESRNEELIDIQHRNALADEIQMRESTLGMRTMQEAYPERLTAMDIRAETAWGKTGLDTPWDSLPDDYINGDCKPLYQQEQDTQSMRGLGRWISGTDLLVDGGMSAVSRW